MSTTTTATSAPTASEHGNQSAPAPIGPPSRHQLALMIWIAVFPTLTLLSLIFGPWLADANPVARTFVLATIAVPTIVYGEMPWLQRARVAIVTRRAA